MLTEGKMMKKMGIEIKEKQETKISNEQPKLQYLLKLRPQKTNAWEYT